jgi:hypothetical protein
MKNGAIYTGITAVMLLTAVSAAADVDFLVPGVSLHSVDFTAGTSVSYLIISEAHGIRDSSLVTLKVKGMGTGGAGLEISSTTWPPVDNETITVRLTLCPGAGEMKTPEEFYACISDILVRNGTEPFREPSFEELEDFDIGRLFLRRSEGLQRQELEPEIVEVPAGRFTCDVYEYFRSDRRDVAMGGITAERFEEERSILRISSEVPFWGLVRSRVERTTKTNYPGGRNPREAVPKVTVTESVLIDYSSPGREAGK